VVSWQECLTAIVEVLVDIFLFLLTILAVHIGVIITVVLVLIVGVTYDKFEIESKAAYHLRPFSCVFEIKY
jgi:Mn2+/Fe2+ NRAMP family transporter